MKPGQLTMDFDAPPPRKRKGSSSYPPELYGGMPGHRDTDTSREAARSVRESSGVWRGRVLDYIKQTGGATADEAAVHFGVAHNTVAPRLTELSLLVQVVDSGERRATRAGRKAIVWKAA